MKIVNVSGDKVGYVFLDLHAVKKGVLVVAANVPLEEAMAHKLSAKVVVQYAQAFVQFVSRFPGPVEVAKVLDEYKQELGAAVLAEHAQRVAKQSQLARQREILVQRGMLGGEETDLLATKMGAAVREKAMRVRRALWCGKVCMTPVCSRGQDPGTALASAYRLAPARLRSLRRMMSGNSSGGKPQRGGRKGKAKRKGYHVAPCPPTSLQAAETMWGGGGRMSTSGAARRAATTAASRVSASSRGTFAAPATTS